MKTNMSVLQRTVGFLAMALMLLSCEKHGAPSTFQTSEELEVQRLWSEKGREYLVEFAAVYKSSFTSLEAFNSSNKQNTQKNILHLLRFLSGPLTHREWAGVYPQGRVELDAEGAFSKEGFVFVPYRYFGKWLVSKDLQGSSLRLPVPYYLSGLQTPNWKLCGDSHPDHQFMSLLWYYWDPDRYGCDHQEGFHYQTVIVYLRDRTELTQETYPEYEKMIRWIQGVPTLEMTFAFGYVEDPAEPKPFEDRDSGALEFQKFHHRVESWAAAKNFELKVLSPQDYGYSSKNKIGSEWVGTHNGVRHVIRVLMAAQLDQMEIFAKSFAENHEGFFGWFGHSRVGSGFDADRLREMIFQSPETFSISPEYQLVYWGGCNSYAYYSQPFFEMKKNESEDPFGTRSLDLLTNALPSYFSLNATNASFVFEALVNANKKTSYQSLVKKIELAAQSWGIRVLVNVLGDEDNGEQ